MLINTKNFSKQLFENKTNRFSSLCEVIDLYKVNSNVFVVSSCGDIIQFNINTHQFKLIRNTISAGNIFDNSGTDKFGHIYMVSQQDMIYFSTQELQFHPATYYTKNTTYFG